jgi:glycosyltransferase involved in cell wall biosynthesis
MASIPGNSQPPDLGAEDLRRAGGTRLMGIIAKNTANQPLVTVVTAVFNGQPYVAGCLESVLRQDYPNIEHIVLDGGSTDGTVDVLREYNDRIALWKSEPDRGIYDAWNKALGEARGEWICFLGVDDEFLPGAVGAYMALAAEHPQAEYLSSKVNVIHPSGYVRVLGAPWNWKKFSKGMCTPHVGSMHRCSLLARLGEYDTSYRSAADYELLLRARDQLRAAYMPVLTVTIRAGGVSCNRRALDEQARAKVSTGGRSKILTSIEMYVEKAKTFFHPPVRYALGKLLGQSSNLSQLPAEASRRTSIRST